MAPSTRFDTASGAPITAVHVHRVARTTTVYCTNMPRQSGFDCMQTSPAVRLDIPDPANCKTLQRIRPPARGCSRTERFPHSLRFFHSLRPNWSGMVCTVEWPARTIRDLPLIGHLDSPLEPPFGEGPTGASGPLRANEWHPAVPVPPLWPHEHSRHGTHVDIGHVLSENVRLLTCVYRRLVPR